jgi:DNA repair protein RecN (Recombination protein N)
MGKGRKGLLKELFIENLAVIERADIPLEGGLNVFTGETGAGKSIVIDAINAVLGQRTSRELIRHGKDKAGVTARFIQVEGRAAARLAEYGYELSDGELVISREIGAGGAARINGRPVAVSILREIGAELINIHGQHDNQILLAPEKHMEILDRYGDFGGILEEYAACYREVVRIKRELKHTAMNEQEKSQRMDLLSYQVQEITAAALRPGEEEELELKRASIRNAERILSGFQSAYGALYGNEGEGGAVDLARMATQSMERTADLYEGAGELYARLDGAAAELDAAAEGISSLIESFGFSQAELDSVEARLDELQKLKRKYGATVEEIQAYLDQAREELSRLELSDQRIQELNEQGSREYQRLLGLADKVSAQREKAAKRFTDSVIEELRFLDMPSVRLEVRQERGKPGPRGRDSIEFLISTNVGEPPKPIAKIASGGELSRIMLAIKNTLADRDDIPTLIFDEVDTGVSGRAAQKIGLKLKQAAGHRQILTVTHLPQIAALGDWHYLIRKESDGAHTFTNVTRLSDEERTVEVARILSTDQITDLMLETAREMILQGRKAPDQKGVKK